MLGDGLTTDDPVIVHGHYIDESGGVMRLGLTPAFYNDLVFVNTSPFTATLRFSGEVWSSDLIGTGFNYAAVGNGVVCVADIDNDLYGFDAVEGYPLWTFSEAANPTYHSPVIEHGLVYLAKSLSDDVKVPIALDARTGAEVWAYDFDGRVESPMSIYEDLVVFCDADHLYALDARTGEYRWGIETDPTGSALIALSDGVALIGTFAVEISSGRRLWRAAEVGVGRYFSRPAVSNGTVCYATDDGHFIALDLKTGELKWQFDAQLVPRLDGGKYSDPAISNGVVYFGFNRFLYALDVTSGEEIWRYEFEGYDFEIIGSPVLGTGYLYVTVGNNRLYAITNQVTRHYFVIDTEVYQNPSTGSPVVETFYGGTTIDEIGEVEDHNGEPWRKVTIGDVTGWIRHPSTDSTTGPTDYEDWIYTP